MPRTKQEELVIVSFFVAASSAFPYVIMPVLNFLYANVAPVRWCFDACTWVWSLCSGGLYLEFHYWRTVFDMQIDWWMRYIWAGMHSLAVKVFAMLELALSFSQNGTKYHKFMILCLGTLYINHHIKRFTHIDNIHRYLCLFLSCRDCTSVLSRASVEGASQ